MFVVVGLNQDFQRYSEVRYRLGFEELLVVVNYSAETKSTALMSLLKLGDLVNGSAEPLQVDHLYMNDVCLKVGRNRPFQDNEKSRAPMDHQQEYSFQPPPSPPGLSPGEWRLLGFCEG